MHKQILSERERKMLEQFITDGKTPETFRMLRMLIKRNYIQISQDFRLIEKVYEKFKQ
jgi:hypothetical protein